MNKIIATIVFIATAIFFMPVASASEISSPDLPAGSLKVSNDQAMGFPLKHTSVDAKISGYVAEVEVKQEYVNPYKVPIEAVYVFPLPNKAAIYDMEIKVGQKTIKSQIKTREEAKRIYEQAKEEGKRAGLLEQERPNIFTQSVANILPGDEITVTIRYTEELVFDENRYKFVFPMVVGPRYIPGGWLEENFVSGVTDYERITPPYLKPEMRSGHDISLNLSIDTGDIPITKISSVTHHVDIAQKSKSNAYVKIKQDDTIPNKDFVLDFELSGDTPQLAFFTHKPENGDGYFSLMIQPQTNFSISDVTPKEMFFVVDVSGSMSGTPIEKAKEAMTYALKNLNPEDTFYIIKFSNKTLRLSDKPLSNTPENIIAGLQYIDNIKAGGGTEMVPGISEALKYRQDPNKLRLVAIMGDGYVGNEKEILAELQDNLGDQTRVFYFGIGSSSNRYLIDKVAEIGRGFAYYITIRDNSENVVEEFYERISFPLFTNLSIDWGGLEVEELYPNLIPDLFAGQPLYIHGKYKKPAKGKISVSGKVASVEEGLRNFIPKIFGAGTSIKTEQQFFDISVNLPSNCPDNEWVGRLWARSKIEDLSNQMFKGVKPGLVEEITRLGLEHRLMTAYTSFVAVEEISTIDPEGLPIKVEVPLELPEGTLYEGFFGPEDKGGSMNISNPLKSNSFGGSQIGWGAMQAPAGVPMDINQGVVNIVKWIFGLFATIFIFVSICGIVQYLFARRDKEKVDKARRVVASGISGIVLTGLVYLLIVIATTVVLLDVGSSGDLLILAVAILFLSGVAIKALFGIIKPSGNKDSKMFSHLLVFVIISATILGLLHMLDILRLPIIVLVAILILAYSKRLSWRKALLISTLGMVLHYAFISYNLINIVNLNSGIINRTDLSSKILMFMPILLFIAYLLSLIGLFFKKRCVFAFTIVLTIFIVIRILFSGAWTITAIGWNILVFMIIPGLYFTRGDFRKR